MRSAERGIEQYIAENGTSGEEYRRLSITRHEMYETIAKTLMKYALGYNDENLLLFMHDATNAYEKSASLYKERGRIDSSMYDTDQTVVDVPKKFDIWASKCYYGMGKTNIYA